MTDPSHWLFVVIVTTTLVVLYVLGKRWDEANEDE